MGNGSSRYVLQHLANERTLLAWIRTIVSISGVAYALVKILNIYAKIPNLIHIAATALPFSGVLATIYATTNYLRTRVRINGEFETSQHRSLATVYGLLVSVALIAVFALIIQFIE